MSHNTEWLTQQGQEDAIKEEVVERLEEQGKINHPSHYTFSSIEPIDVIDDWGLDGDFYLATVIKYIARCGLKEGSSELEDLKKAQWYLSRKIQNLQTEYDNEKFVEDLLNEPEEEVEKEPITKLSPLQRLAKAMGLTDGDDKTSA